jgi:Galactose oxidase, central domain
VDDLEVFEARLSGALQRFVADGQIDIDSTMLARSIAAETPRRRVWRSVRDWQLPRTSLSPVAFVALMLVVALLAAIGIVVGGYVLLRTPMLPLPVQKGEFQSTGSLAIGREQAAATTLADGRVLITGGYGSPPSRLAELWDPSTGRFTPAGELAEGRWGHTSTLLPGGGVLIAGGLGLSAGDSTSLLFSAEVWDPATRTFSTTGSTSGGHLHSMSRLLPDGRVLISGGTLLNVGPSAAPEVWDPATGRFNSGSAIPGARAPAGVLLEGNRVLWLDGSSVSMWDPATSQSHTVASLLGPHGTGTSLTLLADARVLVLGGMPTSGGDRLTIAEIIDPVLGTSELTGSLAEGRADHVAVLLPDGRVLVGGGNAGEGRSAEIFEPP